MPLFMENKYRLFIRKNQLWFLKTKYPPLAMAKNNDYKPAT